MRVQLRNEPNNSFVFSLGSETEPLRWCDEDGLKYSGNSVKRFRALSPGLESVSEDVPPGSIVGKGSGAFER
jgi:hypothetical protein